VLLLTSGRVCFTHWFPQVIAFVVDGVGFIRRWFAFVAISMMSIARYCSLPVFSRGSLLVSEQTVDAAVGCRSTAVPAVVCRATAVNLFSVREDCAIVPCQSHALLTSGLRRRCRRCRQRSQSTSEKTDDAAVGCRATAVISPLL